MELERLIASRLEGSDFSVLTPDRYFDTASGTLTLIGLSYAETTEFMALNVTFQADHAARLKCQLREQAAQETRWHQLGQKHEAARQAWLRERATPVW